MGGYCFAFEFNLGGFSTNGAMCRVEACLFFQCPHAPMEA